MPMLKETTFALWLPFRGQVTLLEWTPKVRQSVTLQFAAKGEKAVLKIERGRYTKEFRAMALERMKACPQARHVQLRLVPRLGSAQRSGSALRHEEFSYWVLLSFSH